MNEFSRAYQDFTDHYVEIDEDEIKVYAETMKKFWDDIEKKAEALELTVDYYIQEFM